MAAPKIQPTDNISDYPVVQNALADEVDAKAGSGHDHDGAYAPLAQYMVVVREVDGTYEARPPVQDFPVAMWVGESDATEEQAFVEWNPTTGVADIWASVPNE